MKCHERFLDEFLAHSIIENPYPLYTALQEDGPLAYVAPHELWLVSGYQDCLAVLKASAFEQWDGNEFFLGRSQPMQARKRALQGALWQESNSRASVSWYDPAASLHISQGDSTSLELLDHAPMQMLIYRALAVKQHSVGLEALIRQRAHTLIQTFSDARTVECVNQFALPLPMLVLGDLFGLDWGEWVQFFLDWICRMRPGVRLPRKLIGYGPSRMSKMGFRRYLTRVIEERLRQPRDDILTAIAHADFRMQDIDQTGLEQMIEHMSMYAVLTTADLIGNALWLILRHPDASLKIAVNPALIPNTLYEVLRIESPVQGLFRRARREYELPTGRIPGGAGLLVLLAAANRDARQFPHPDQFDRERSNARSHLGFGSGAHACAGSQLALLIARIAIETLLTQFPHICLIEDQAITHHPNRLNRGLQALHVQLAR